MLSAAIDDAVTSGANRFTYSGSSWTFCGCGSGAYQSAFHYAYTTGNSATITFSGSQLKVYGFKEPVGGIATVSIDGGAAVDLDYYAASSTLTQLLVTPVLTTGSHTVVFTVSGRRGNGSSTTINLDKAEIYTSN
ncbi:MAG: polysaccharide deacetylase [Mycobacterium sp.]|nr:polysaccharide deacetylase [Mycobacterium sp.]